MVDKHIVAARLVATRAALGWDSQQDYAAAAGFSKTTYNNWETGERLIPPSSAVQLCERFGLTLDFIYVGRLDTLPQNVAKALSSSPADKNQSTSSPMVEAAETSAKALIR